MKIRGVKLVFPHPSFNPSEALKSISNEKCSIWFGTPTMYLGMILNIFFFERCLELGLSSLFKIEIRHPKSSR